MSERKEKFTPGPWEMYEVLDHNDNPRVGVQTHPDQETIYEEYGPHQVDRANAYLIAAAPELYDYIRRNIDDDEARDLLAKARGEA